MMTYFHCCGTSPPLQIRTTISSSPQRSAGSPLRVILNSSMETPSDLTAFPFANERMVSVNIWNWQICNRDCSPFYLYVVITPNFNLMLYRSVVNTAAEDSATSIRTSLLAKYWCASGKFYTWYFPIFLTISHKSASEARGTITQNALLIVYCCTGRRIMCVLCFLPIHSGLQWTYQPGSHKKKVTQDFPSTFFLRCLP